MKRLQGDCLTPETLQLIEEVPDVNALEQGDTWTWLQERSSQLGVIAEKNQANADISKVVSIAAWFLGFASAGTTPFGWGVLGASSAVWLWSVIADRWDTRKTHPFPFIRLGVSEWPEYFNAEIRERRAEMMAQQGISEEVLEELRILSYLKKRDELEAKMLFGSMPKAAELLAGIDEGKRFILYLWLQSEYKRAGSLEHINQGDVISYSAHIKTADIQPAIAPAPIHDGEPAQLIDGQLQPIGLAPIGLAPKPLAPPALAPSRIGAAGDVIDLVEILVAQPQNMIVFGKPRSGKGFLLAKCSRRFLEVYDDAEMWLVDPRNRPNEQHYWAHIRADRSLHFDLSDFNFEPEQYDSQVCDLVRDFNDSPCARKVLIFLEYKAFSRVFAGTEALRRISNYVVTLSSSGSTGQAHEGLGRFAWLETQDPQLSSLGGFRNTGDRGGFALHFLFDLSSGRQMHSDLVKTSLIPNLPDWATLAPLANCPAKRFFYCGTRDQFSGLPHYELTPMQPPAVYASAAANVAAEAMGAGGEGDISARLYSVLKPPTSGEELGAALFDCIRQNSPVDTSRVDLAIAGLGQLSDPRAVCMQDFLGMLKIYAETNCTSDPILVRRGYFSKSQWATKWKRDGTLFKQCNGAEYEIFIEAAIKEKFLIELDDGYYQVCLGALRVSD